MLAPRPAAWGAAMCLAVLAIAATPAGTPPPARDPAPEATPAPALKEIDEWRLEDSVLVTPGSAVEMAEGRFTRGAVVRAAARPAGGGRPATFEMTFSVFAPSHAQPGLTPGRYYVHGAWTISDRAAAAGHARHSAGRIGGSLNAELAFNPLVATGPVRGVVAVPMSPDGGRWGAARGEFTGDQNFTGLIRLAHRAPAGRGARS